MNKETRKEQPQKNGKTNELNEYKPADESAMLHKAVAYLFALIASLRDGEIDSGKVHLI